MKKNSEASLDPLSVIEEEARAIARHYGAQKCHEAAAALMDRLIIRLGGLQIYVPLQSAAFRKNRDAQVRLNFNGRNIKELARKFNMSERSIRRIASLK